MIYFKKIRWVVCVKYSKIDFSRKVKIYRSSEREVDKSLFLHTQNVCRHFH